MKRNHTTDGVPPKFVIRPFHSADLSQIKDILRQTMFEQIRPAFVQTVRHSIFLSCTFCTSAAVTLLTSSVFWGTVAALLLIALVLLAYVASSVWMVYGSNSNDIDPHLWDYDIERKSRLWVAEVKGEDGITRIVGTIAIVNRADDGKTICINKVETERTLNVRCVARTAQLRRMAVLPAFRGMGIARALIQTTVEFCREHRFTRIFLITTWVHTRARSLYEQYGFRCIASPTFSGCLGQITRLWTYEYEYYLLNINDFVSGH